VLACGCTGGGGGGASAGHRELTADERYQLAFPVAASFLRAAVAGSPDASWAAPRTPAERRSIEALRARLSVIPVRTLDVETASLELPAPREGVIATLSAELGPAPSTGQVLLGQVALAVAPDARGRWFVTADISSSHRRLLNRWGLLSLSGLHYSVGTASVVVDASGARELSFGAGIAQRTADRELPLLNARYGGPRRALIAIVPDRAAVSLFVAGAIPGEPSAVAWHGEVVLVDEMWRAWGDPGAQGVVVHELTHLVTERWMSGVPASLAEGLAQEEQDRYQHREGTYLPLDPLVTAYRLGYPTLARWAAGTAGWRLGGRADVELAYDDGQAMVHTVLAAHGGLPALRRLADRFARLGGPPVFTAAEVRQAFRSALGVGFAQVARQARRWVQSRSWSHIRGSPT
jgi:hypothetical protein